MKHPAIDLSECILCGVCVDVCAEVFQLNDAGFIQVIAHNVYPGPDVEEAIRSCPADCIGWEEE